MAGRSSTPTSLRHTVLRNCDLRKYFLTRAAFFLLVSSIFIQFNLSAQLPSGFISQQVASDFNAPMGLAFTSDGTKMFTWELGGKLYVSTMTNSGYTRQSQPVLDISDEVGAWGDFGLLSICLDPQFNQNGYIYLYYCVDRHHLLFAGTPQYNPQTNTYVNATIGRVTRYTVSTAGNNITCDSASRKILIGDTKKNGVPVLFQSHLGGSLVFGTDGSLLLSTGEMELLGPAFSVA
jgi:glucose/arabinose dehydrogenase